MVDSDDKYIVFRRDDFIEMLNFQGLEHLTANMLGDAQKIEITDAVVIRRQDKFAAPALATYAACIAIVASETTDPAKKRNLLMIGDYFQRMSELAGEADNVTKLPDV